METTLQIVIVIERLIQIALSGRGIHGREHRTTEVGDLPLAIEGNRLDLVATLISIVEILKLLTNCWNNLIMNFDFYRNDILYQMHHDGN